MLKFRITKYDPQYRDASGAYTHDDWTSYSDVGQAQAGEVLSLDEYQRVEGAYIDVAVRFLREAGVSEMVVRGFENSGNKSTFIREGAVLTLEQAAEVIRGILREEFWCRLEAGSSYVHVGWDFYMYIGVPSECPSAQAAAKQHGLFVEAFASPFAKSAA